MPQTSDSSAPPTGLPSAVTDTVAAPTADGGTVVVTRDPATGGAAAAAAEPPPPPPPAYTGSRIIFLDASNNQLEGGVPPTLFNLGVFHYIKDTPW
ncbi:hypothetical protein MNEG_12988 [Monoraphidium neglectum]|uniref:Uncharacterized protein n=1 Tax=Monoraphidium neglectum TaxID=145388 RepID=A0A0D2M0B0_9CHLO|nr:hypothetical protein MNEG_12988 [Monoraphidium neglectum]KIY94976.1 hypothetical protein MNEG_12988 [Monoraphidium neglectum]|eukprot:XP_013893996.1 hypothetical protein MNEG_12988 [Monoraphidium neglectum]